MTGGRSNAHAGRQGRFDYFPKRTRVIVCHPSGEFQDFGTANRLSIDEVVRVLDVELAKVFGNRVVERDDVTGDELAPERHRYTRADLRLRPQ